MDLVKNNMNYIKNFFKKHKLFLLLLTILILSLIGGLISSIIVKSYFLDASYNFSSLNNIDFSQGKFKDQGIIISNAKNVIVQQDVKIEETIKSVSQSLVGIYKKQKISQVNNFSLNNFYKINDADGQGFIITSDGWIITTLSLEKVYVDYVVIAQDKKIYQIDKAISDISSGFTFIHVAVKDFPVRKFIESQDINEGNFTICINWSGLSWISSVLGFTKKNELVESSDSFTNKLILNSDVPQDFKGAVVFNMAGDVLGLINLKGEIEPIYHLESAVNSLFKHKSIKRPSLGVNYINLSSLIYGADNQNKNWQKGAIIARDQKGVAVKKNSSAEKAGLREGDIIISVGNIILNEFNNLADIIQNYAAEDKITIEIIRSGVAEKIEVILGEQK